MRSTLCVTRYAFHESMDIIIDLSSINAFFNQPSYVIMQRLLLLFGWIPVCFVFLWGALQM
ncbi:hypothetical protein KJ978_02680, partial [Patescibacteria group bacterium]|nr:hypothetical protein [Patescibacteria group bacterium]